MNSQGSLSLLSYFLFLQYHPLKSRGFVLLVSLGLHTILDVWPFSFLYLSLLNKFHLTLHVKTIEGLSFLFVHLVLALNPI